MVNFGSVREAIREVGFKHVTPSSNSYHTNKQNNDERWSIIQPYITGGRSGLDIGCASGFFTGKMAQHGLFALGIDDLSQNPDRLLHARQSHGKTEDAGFANWQVTPDNVGGLPSFDLILLMNVFHHFVKAFGIDAAGEIVSEVGINADTVVIEFPAWRWSGRRFSIRAVEVGSGQEHVLHNHRDISGYGSRVRPDLTDVLPPGDYDICAEADGLEASNSLRVSVGGRSADERPRIKIDDRKATLIPMEDDDGGIEDMVNWYEEFLHNTFPENMHVLERQTVFGKLSDDSPGGRRQTVMYVLDTTGVNG